LIQHQLFVKLQYTWTTRKNYSSASFCDKWQGCENEPQVDITLISSSASSCSPSECDYTEVMELNLTDDFLRSSVDDGFSVSFNSKKSTNEITIASDYLKGYIKIAN